MKYSIKGCVVIFCATMLIGCSGGSSSTGVSASTPYAGQYDGTVVMRMQGLGETASQVVPIRVVVGVDGRVTAGNPSSSSAGTCNLPEKSSFLTGNSINASATFKCSIPGVGTCTVSGTETVTFSNQAASFAGRYGFNCPQGRVNADASGYLKKTV